MGFYFEAGTIEHCGVVAEEGEVVHVAQVMGDVECAVDKAIEVTQIQICEKLAGEIADG